MNKMWDFMYGICKYLRNSAQIVFFSMHKIITFFTIPLQFFLLKQHFRPCVFITKTMTYYVNFMSEVCCMVYQDWVKSRIKKFCQCSNSRRYTPSLNNLFKILKKSLVYPIFKLVLIFFFICLLAAPQLTLGHC